jgi:hypothetical protein
MELRYVRSGADSAAIAASYGATRVVQDDFGSVRVAKFLHVGGHGCAAAGANLSQRGHSAFVLRLLEALAPGGMADRGTFHAYWLKRV